MIALTVITPQRVLIDRTVDEIVLPTPQGHIGILPHHTPLITAISPGELKVRIGNAIDYVAIGSGFAKVTGDTAAVLTDLAVRAEEIDEAKEQEARARAQAALVEIRSDEEIAATLAMIERITAKLQIKRRHRSRVPSP